MPDQDNQKKLQDDAAAKGDSKDDNRDRSDERPESAVNTDEDDDIVGAAKPLETGTSTVRSPQVVEETDRVPTAPNSQANFAENETVNAPEYKKPGVIPEVVTEERNPTVRELVNTVQSAASRLSNAVVSGNVTRQLLDEVNADLSRVDRDANYLLGDGEGGVTS